MESEVAVNRGGTVSAAKAYEGKKGQTRRRFYDCVIVYMPGVNGVTDCHPSVLSKDSARKKDFKRDGCALIQGHMHAHAQARTRAWRSMYKTFLYKIKSHNRQYTY